MKTQSHGAVVTIGFDRGQGGFVQFADGTKRLFPTVREAEAFARAGAGQGYCIVPGCTSPAGSPCPNFVPGATATLCNHCNHLKSKHTGDKSKADFESILAALV